MPVPQIVFVQRIARVVDEQNEVKIKKTVGMQVKFRRSYTLRKECRRLVYPFQRVLSLGETIVM